MLSRTVVNRRFAVVLAATLLALLAGFFLTDVGSGRVPSAHAQSPVQTTVVYQPTDALFANPEQGFYHHTETHSNAYAPLNLATLQGYRQNENITLILRLFYLDDFVASPISQAYLDAMAADFATLRQAGLKAVVRVAYTDQIHFAPSTSWPPIPPYGDASKTQMLAHIAQLAPVLQANADVISAVQAGFIGIWGEWYYTDYFVDDPNDPGTVSPEKYAERGEVLNAIINALPGRMVQVRTPLIKQKIYGTGTGAGNALPPANAFNGSGPARAGHHNDCFLASESDFGTYSDITEDKAYLGEETKYLPMGGETCNPNPPRSECPIALAELAAFHWSYLNTDYHPGVLGSWATGGCLDTVKRRLGYRLALIEGRYPDIAQVGNNLDIEVDLRNEGWAAPFNPRPLELVLRHQTTLAVHRFPLAVDPRFWLADNGGNHSIVQSIPLPANLPTGAYDLLLSLPDPSPALAARAEYAIRLANAGIWEDGTGLNNLLHAVTIQPPDLHLPIILASAVKADLSPYSAGMWTNQTVTVHFDCSDADSGVAFCTGDQAFDADGVTPSVNGTATDNAGNSANSSFGPVQIDKTAPDTAITGQPTDPSSSAGRSLHLQQQRCPVGAGRF